MPSLLVTNDFPPKVGGIQSYLHELWRRLPPEDTTVLTTPHEGADAFDAAEAFRIERTPERELFPMCSSLGLSICAWGALGSGFLSGKYRRGGEIPAGTRFGPPGSPWPS